jgi:SET domain-containing protein
MTNIKSSFKTVIIECRPSKIDGVGVFAVRKISKGQTIAEGVNKKDYDDLVPWKKIKSLDQDIKKKINDFCLGTPEGFLPPEDNDFNKLSIEWYMNHSCNGNIGFNANGDFVAIKDIKKDEELTYDYALAESNQKFSMKCNCGSSNCRHLITGNDWKDSEFRKKNLNHMLPKLRKAY